VRTILALAFIAAVLPASAKAMEDHELYALLGSEEPCGLHYDQAAIERLVTKYFKPDDTMIVSQLSTNVGGYKILLQEMSASALTAQCTQVRRAAKHYGLIQ
jgi:hypothetical protein